MDGRVCVCVCVCVCVRVCVCVCLCVCVYVVGGWAQVGLYYCLFIPISTSCTSVSWHEVSTEGGPFCAWFPL